MAGWARRLRRTVSDILFGTPKPIRSRVNLGVLAADKVNIIVHGHEPTLSEMLAVASHDQELLAYARSKGANGINIAGICCTANEVLMRHGLPIAGNFLQQELAILTGAVEVMMIDVQCVMPSLAQVAKCFHTKTGQHLGDRAQPATPSRSPSTSNDGYEHACHLIRDGDRQLRAPRPRARPHSERIDGTGGRLLERDHLPHAGRPLPQHLPPAERRHHRRPHPRHRRHRRLQQSRR